MKNFWENCKNAASDHPVIATILVVTAIGIPALIVWACCRNKD